MKITKTARETVYQKSVILHTLEVNGKTVRVESVGFQDTEFGDYEYETNILNEDILTAEEIEAIDANMTELLDLAPDESTTLPDLCAGCGGEVLEGQSISGDRHSTCI